VGIELSIVAVLRTAAFCVGAFLSEESRSARGRFFKRIASSVAELLFSSAFLSVGIGAAEALIVSLSVPASKIGSFPLSFALIEATAVSGSAS